MVLQYWLSLFLNPSQRELDSEAVEEELCGAFDAHWDVTELSNGENSVILNVSPPVSEIFIGYPGKDGNVSQAEYELWFAEFLEANGQKLKELGFEGFRITMRIYHVKGQPCNFYVFFGESLNRICKFDVLLHTMVSAISKENMDGWASSGEGIEW